MDRLYMSNGLTRRALLSSGAALITATTAARSAAQERLPAASRLSRPGRTPTVYAYVGCYTTRERNARGDGIHVYRMDPGTGAWSHIQHLGGLVNPSFLVLGRDQRCVYSVHGDETYATAFSVDRGTGHLTLLNRAETGSRNGAHQAIDPSGRFMVVANYASGSVAVLPVRQDGTLGNQIQLVQLEGKPGPNPAEQASSHPHHVVFDPSGRFVVVPDKGLDRVFVFRFDSDTGRLTPTDQASVVARPGSAPRHAAFHPKLPVLWVVNELGSNIATYRWDAERGSLHPVQLLSTVPPEYTGRNSGAEVTVSPDGRFVYCSNRGHNSTAIFATDSSTGQLTSAGWVPTQGKTPRFITFDPSYRFFYAANEQSDTVVTFRADTATGHLTPTGQTIANLSPVTIAFANWDA